MKKILVTEDNDSNYLLMTYILKGHYEFERARHGQEAVEMVEKGSYDMVLMDLRMPSHQGEASRPADYRADCQCLRRRQKACAGGWMQ